MSGLGPDYHPSKTNQNLIEVPLGVSLLVGTDIPLQRVLLKSRERRPESNIENEVRDRESYEVAQHFGSINVATSGMIGMFGLAIFLTRPKKLRGNH